jgi:hypothetical protein
MRAGCVQAPAPQARGQVVPFTGLGVTKEADEEQVGDIFVRINSEGVKRNRSHALSLHHSRVSDRRDTLPG